MRRARAAEKCAAAENHWLGIRLVGKKATRRIGAKISWQAGRSQAQPPESWGWKLFSSHGSREVLGIGKPHQKSIIGS